MKNGLKALTLACVRGTLGIFLQTRPVQKKIGGGCPSRPPTSHGPVADPRLGKAAFVDSTDLLIIKWQKKRVINTSMNEF